MQADSFQRIAVAAAEHRSTCADVQGHVITFHCWTIICIYVLAANLSAIRLSNQSQKSSISAWKVCKSIEFLEPTIRADGGMRPYHGDMPWVDHPCHDVLHVWFGQGCHRVGVLHGFGQGFRFIGPGAGGLLLRISIGVSEHPGSDKL